MKQRKGFVNNFFRLCNSLVEVFSFFLEIVEKEIKSVSGDKKFRKSQQNWCVFVYVMQRRFWRKNENKNFSAENVKLCKQNNQPNYFHIIVKKRNAKKRRRGKHKFIHMKEFFQIFLSFEEKLFEVLFSDQWICCNSIQEIFVKENIFHDKLKLQPSAILFLKRVISENVWKLFLINLKFIDDFYRWELR